MATSLYPARKHVLRTLDKLVKLLPASEKVKPQLILLTGEVTPYRNDTDREIVFRQESNFFYLTGCDVPGSYLLIAYQPGTSLEEHPAIELFIPKAEPADIMWSVPPPSATDAAFTHDVSKVLNTDVLQESIETYLKALPDALFHTLNYNSPLYPKTPATYTDLVINNQNGTAITDLYLLPALSVARLTKDKYEIDLIRQACDISSRAHETVMRVLGLAVKGKIDQQAAKDRPLLPGEWLIEKECEAEAIFVASCRREGSVHQAYLPIVAASIRASTLHYCCNDKEFSWGPVGPNEPNNTGSLTHTHSHAHPGKVISPQVLLIDAGCEWNNYASDITRTMPVGNGGKFSKEAREIYELVLHMQEQAYAVIKPGLHWDGVQLACHRALIGGFQKLGIFYSPQSENSGSWNSEEAILASGISAAFFPHGVGHSLGMDVHDVPPASKPAINPTLGKNGTGIGEVEGEGGVGHESFYAYLRLRLPLHAGMVVTVEPGIYFSPHLLAPVRDSKHINHEVLKQYEDVGGVRIEDVVLITEGGYENLTKVKKDVKWLEGVCSGEL